LSLDVTFGVWAKDLEAEVTFFDVHFPEDKAFLNDILSAVIQVLVNKSDLDPDRDSAGWAIKSVKRDGVTLHVHAHTST